ncbi:MULTISPECIES: hypothetical protein [Burkholderia]|uniref:hypothetical protein n=1 Tax=Burkholderia TaxID=32008 RepID=UPI0012E3839E|nr:MULTISPECIES: hypothetical protein [Burkholderia]
MEASSKGAPDIAMRSASVVTRPCVTSLVGKNKPLAASHAAPAFTPTLTPASSPHQQPAEDALVKPFARERHRPPNFPATQHFFGRRAPAAWGIASTPPLDASHIRMPAPASIRTLPRRLRSEYATREPNTGARRISPAATRLHAATSDARNAHLGSPGHHGRHLFGGSTSHDFASRITARASYERLIRIIAIATSAPQRAILQRSTPGRCLVPLL